MPKRTPADYEAILKLYEETGNAQEVARRMGIHPNTVYIALRRDRGKCKSGCDRPAVTGKVYCQGCLDRLAVRKKRERADRRCMGTCTECGGPIDREVSTKLCRKHWLLSKEAARRAYAKTKAARQGSYRPQPSVSQRRRRIIEKHGYLGYDAWLRDDAACVVCRATVEETAVHLHHIDLDPTNNSSVDNFACLCFDCHRLVHAILGNQNAEEAIAWIAMTYPGFKPPQHE